MSFLSSNLNRSIQNLQKVFSQKRLLLINQVELNLHGIHVKLKIKSIKVVKVIIKMESRWYRVLIIF